MLPREVSQAVFTRDGFKCRRCGWRGNLHPHHVIHKSQRGSDTLDNLITLCSDCHRLYHDGKIEIIVVEKQEKNIIVKFKMKTRVGSQMVRH